MNTCKCGCGIALRKDNKTGYQKNHRSCAMCGKLTKGQSECCSKSCSAELHWKRNPDMAESRTWNADRYATRELNRDTWVENLSNACKGRTPWNKDVTGLQTAWNKNLPAEQQPFYGKTHSKSYYEKRDKTVLDRYGVKCAFSLAKTSPRSKKEKLLETILPEYKTNSRVGKYKPDYVNEETKHIIEVYGDYWHCHPALFDDNQYHPQLKMTAKQKREQDRDRIEYLTQMGYQVTIVWECDLLDFMNNRKEKH
jgi:G:T-mismatch repair DNA endonuclease (very short patch repair protein)